MTRKSPYPVALVCLLTCALAIPFDALALPDATGQRAGEVSRVIPAVNLLRGAKSMNASAETPVDWEASLNNQSNGPAAAFPVHGFGLKVGSGFSPHGRHHQPR